MLDAEWSRAGRSGKPLALTMLDLDYFKPYNDTYGHQSGDDCLRAVAHLLANNVRRALNQLALPHSVSPFQVVTASIGIAVVVSGKADTPQGLLQMADAALCQAKQQGRNQVVLAR